MGEHWGNQFFQEAVREFIPKMELNLAGALRQCNKPPHTFQVLEGTIFQAYLHQAGIRLFVLSRELLPDAVKIDVQGGGSNIFVALYQVDPAAPWQELRVLFYRVHQRIHLRCRKPHQYCFVDLCH